MAVTVANLNTYTDAEILKVLRSALVDAAIAQSYSINGRNLSRLNATQLQSLIEIYEARVEAASTTTGGHIATVKFGGPR